MLYKDYLKTDHWKEMVELYRKEVCEICGSSPVALHHLSYKSLGNEKKSYFATLCFPCHKSCHVSILGIGKLKNHLTTRLKSFRV